MKNETKEKDVEKPKRIITEHPELRWWFNAITVRAHNVNAWYPRPKNYA